MSASELPNIPTVTIFERAWDLYKKQHNEFSQQPSRDQKNVENAAKEVLNSLRNLEKNMSVNPGGAFEGSPKKFALLTKEAFSLFIDKNIQYSDKSKKQLAKITSLFIALNIRQIECHEENNDMICGKPMKEFIEELRVMATKFSQIDLQVQNAMKHNDQKLIKEYTDCFLKQIIILKNAVKDKKIKDRCENYEELLQKITGFDLVIASCNDCTHDLNRAPHDHRDNLIFQNLVYKYQTARKYDQLICDAIIKLFPLVKNPGEKS